MKIITITLNPAFDMHCYTENFIPFSENLAEIRSIDAGGKGINISRALTKNGIPNTALVVIGEENGQSFIKSLEVDNIHYRKISVPGRIRENITLHTNNSPETRISFSGFEIREDILESIKNILFEDNLANTVVTFTGRVPEGVNIDTIKHMLLNIKSKGAKLVIDSRSFGKDDILDLKPFLIKPNGEEIGLYTDISVTDLQTAAKASQSLKNAGVDNVMISLGGKGAVLCCDDGVFAANPPQIKVVSTIGAGDSSIAGFLAAVTNDLPYGDALKYAVSYGSAACLTEGTAAPNSDDISRLLNQVYIEKL